MCSPGEFPYDFTERMMEKYSEKVNDDGFFLGVADAFLFAVKQGKSLAIAVDPQPDRALEVLSARDYLCGILPENIQIERREGDDLDTRVLILGAYSAATPSLLKKVSGITTSQPFSRISSLRTSGLIALFWANGPLGMS